MGAKSLRTYSVREMSSELGLSSNIDASEAREGQDFETEDKHTQSFLGTENSK